MRLRFQLNGRPVSIGADALCIVTSPPTSSASVIPVKVPVTVLASGGAFVANLCAVEYPVLEDGIADEIRSMRAHVNPVSVALVPDTGAAVKVGVSGFKRAATGFVNAPSPLFSQGFVARRQRRRGY